MVSFLSVFCSKKPERSFIQTWSISFIKFFLNKEFNKEIETIRFKTIKRTKIYLPIQVLGHEFSGEIIEIGSKVNQNIGDRVVVNPLIPCESCTPCNEENYQLCENIDSIGRTLPGAFSEQVLVPAKNIIKIPDKMSYEKASLADVYAVAFHNYHLAGSPKEKKILIIGDGAVGLSCLQVFENNNVSILGKHQKGLLSSTDLL